MINIQIGGTMRINIVIDDELMNRALKASKLKIKKDAIKAGLKLLIKFNRQAKVKNTEVNLSGSEILMKCGQTNDSCRLICLD
jgi:Arc/MetJ family transcription regulator